MEYSFIAALTSILAGVYAALLAVYLWAEKHNTQTAGFKRATAVKLTLSAFFCVIGAVFYCFIAYSPFRSSIMPTPHLFILLGLFAAFPGDFFLQYIRRNAKKYIAGILCFSATQILFIIGLFFLYPPSFTGWILIIVLTIVILLAILTVMKKQSWVLKEEKNVLSAYTVLLVFMTATALQTAIFNPSPYSLIFAVGAAFFLSSDILLGLWNYHTSRRLHANLNWITYFTGMFLIALSLLATALSII